MRSRRARSTTWTPAKPSSRTGPAASRTSVRRPFASSTRPRSPRSSKRSRRDVGRSMTASVASGASRRWAATRSRQGQVGVDVDVVEQQRPVAAEVGAGRDEPAAGLERLGRLAGDGDVDPEPVARAEERLDRVRVRAHVDDDPRDAGGDEPPRDALEHRDAADLDERLRARVGQGRSRVPSPAAKTIAVHVHGSSRARARRRRIAGPGRATRPAIAGQRCSSRWRTTRRTSGKRCAQRGGQPLGDVDRAVLAPGAPEVDVERGEPAGDVRLHLRLDQRVRVSDEVARPPARARATGRPRRRGRSGRRTRARRPGLGSARQSKTKPPPWPVSSSG